jgi:arylsulfatase A-like enzyme
MPCSRREFLAGTGAALAVTGASLSGSDAAVPGRPNFVVFYTDDQGWGDLGCMGAEDLRTPHIDVLATSGALLTNWYSNSPVCSPSRASVLTGRYPGNAGVRSILGGHRQATGLPPSVPTLARALKPLGYRSAVIGKWHLGVAEPYRPDKHGFDEWFGFLAGCIDYYSHIFYWGGGDPVHDLWDNGREVWQNGGYFTEMVADRAVRFVESAAGDPFLLYVPFNAPHYPMHAPQPYLDRFPDLPWPRQVMAGMIAAVDDAIGAVVAALERTGVRDRTCIFFQSDNGPSRETRNWLDGTRDPYRGGTTRGLKGHKFSLYEGGIRVPAILNWPGTIPGGQVLDQVGAAMDIFPTLLHAAGGDPSAYELDGQDVLPMVRDGEPSPHERIFWEQGDQTAVREGRWKLVLNGQLVEGAPPEDAVHLSDLSADPGETTNLAEGEPDVAGRLRSEAEAWRAGIERTWSERWAPKAEPATAHRA